MLPFPVSHWGDSAFTASPTFDLPLINTLVPTTATGSATATYSVGGGIGTVPTGKNSLSAPKLARRASPDAGASRTWSPVIPMT